jgi:hypothetical protein
MGTPSCLRPVYPDADTETTFEEGIEFQDFVADLLMAELGISVTSYTSRKWQQTFGENRQGIEIKRDNRILETGNVSIEVAEKSRADRRSWTPSGIMRDDNTWLYIQGNPKIVFVFGKTILRLMYEKKYKHFCREPKKTIRTFLLPIDRAMECALKVFDLRNTDPTTTDDIPF